MGKRGDELIESAKQALAWVRGEDVPGMVVHEPQPAIDVRAVRRKTGLTQAEFARRFGFPVGTLRNWEQGIRTPQGPARALLLVIDAEPEAVLRALGKAA
jgi:putative transcriptional regulator